jgi:hypothetical protein
MGVTSFQLLVTIQTRPDQIEASGASRGNGQAEGDNRKPRDTKTRRMIADEACALSCTPKAAARVIT